MYGYMDHHLNDHSLVSNQVFFVVVSMYAHRGVISKPKSGGRSYVRIEDNAALPKAESF